MAKWKLNEDGNIELRNGNPVVVNADGTEIVVESDTVPNLRREAKTFREERDAARTSLKAFEGLDAEKARDALDKIGKIDQSKLIDAGKVDEVRQQITQQFQTQLSEKDAALSALQQQYDNSRIDHAFANSDFIRDAVAVPRDMFEATFRNNFKIEDGKVVVYGKDGNRLISKTTGDYATPEEGLRMLAESHPQKDVILRADVGNGTGNRGAGGAHGGVGKMKREDYLALATKNPAKYADVGQKLAKGEMQLTD